jgi:hypothetical protein
MLRTTIIFIEFCALLDEGAFPVVSFPAADGDIRPTISFRDYLGTARWYDDAFPSRLSHRQQNVPEMLPCRN